MIAGVKGTTLFDGAAVDGITVACWNHIKIYASKIYGLLVVRIKLEGRNDTGAQFQERCCQIAIKSSGNNSIMEVKQERSDKEIESEVERTPLQQI